MTGFAYGIRFRESASMWCCLVFTTLTFLISAVSIWWKAKRVPSYDEEPLTD
jgi:hypothetical protein